MPRTTHAGHRTWSLGARAAIVATLLAGLAASTSAQLADLQPGRNFPTSAQVLGAGRTSAVDLGDVDNDGDTDVAFSNGADGSVQLNALHLNQGGAQAGTEGTFVDESATRFAGLPADTSRDLAFFDMDDDGDLDLFIANRGTTVNGGEVSRLYRNLGGRQHGAVGFFDEYTDAFWGVSQSVPEIDHIVFGTTGPFRSHVRAVDIADIDDDGDLDVFTTTAGVNFNGFVEERLWLNDGLGTVHELFPWADNLADTKWHSNEVDFADLDGDFDLDLFVSSRNSQSRVFRNELAEGQPQGRLFTDVTQTALIDTLAGQATNTTYGVELGDLDGDGDFDAWLVNYGPSNQKNLDKVLRNDGGLEFRHPLVSPITGDPENDEIEVGFLDFDSDGDLDVHVSNWVGPQRIYQSSLLQPQPEPGELYHRTGFGPGAAPQEELPASGNAQQTNDSDYADMDGDGDPDIVWANDFNQTNRYVQNELGVPDTHAPSFEALTVQGDKADGTPTVIHAAVRDNAGMRVVSGYRAQLVYDVDGGAETCVRMLGQGGQQFRGVLPAGLAGTVSYRVEVVDEAGNLGVSPTLDFVQSNPGTDAVATLGCGTAGVNGVPVFEVVGTLAPSSLTSFRLRRAAPSAFAVLFLALQSTPAPFKQGTLYPVPVDVFLNRSTDAGGLEVFELPWPGLATFPSGLEIWLQYGVSDASVPGAGASLSNAVELRVP